MGYWLISKTKLSLSKMHHCTQYVCLFELIIPAIFNRYYSVSLFIFQLQHHDTFNFNMFWIIFLKNLHNGSIFKQIYPLHIVDYYLAFHKNSFTHNIYSYIVHHCYIFWGVLSDYLFVPRWAYIWGIPTWATYLSD
jgi:hypothetical protein